MTPTPPESDSGKISHFNDTVDNFAFVGSDDLHFAGYFEDESDDLVTSLRNLNEFIAGKLDPSEADELLDVGCGTGGTSCYLAATRGCRVTGIDVGETQLAAANELAAQKGLTELTSFQSQDGTNLSFSSGVFDAVLLLGSAVHVEDKAGLFTECARVAKPGSRLVALDFVIKDLTQYQERRNLRKRQILDAFFGSPSFATRDRYELCLHKAGYAVNGIESMNSHVILSCDAWKRTLEERSAPLMEVLGKPRYLSILIAARTLKQAIQQDLFDGLVFIAERR
jgi:cyclopropane fatty-acyl-phospholipid synthase-like methyltransferase